MSVIEFFSTYWDWYLLIGSCVGMAFTWEILDRESTPMKVLSVLIVTTIWPIKLFQFFMRGSVS